MLSDEVLDKVIERVVNRVEQANTYILEQIGRKIKEIGKLTPTSALQLESMLKYGGDYEKIAQKLAEITNLNVQDIYKIFEEVAKADYQFAGKFYKYRNKKFIPYEFNYALQNEVQAMANITANTYLNLSRTLAFAQREAGNIIYTDLAKTYQETIDKAITSISMGKETFQQEMYKTIKELSASGLKAIDYTSDGKIRHYRLDSAVRSAMNSGLLNLHDGMQEIIGKDIDADGVEISHHLNSAPDHIDTIDGKQFAKIDIIKQNIVNGVEKEIKLSDIKDNKVKVKGKWYYDFDYINDNLERQVSTLNCRHYKFSIVLGISEPEYTQEELKKDKEKNLNGCKIDGQHYTLYEAEQLMRNIELQLRKAKDEQIMGRASGITENVEKAQEKITILTDRYKELSKISGLPTKMDRMRVPNYKRIAISKLK